MDAINGALLLALGFAVGISGALLPGPLLVYTVHESLTRGKWTGVLVICGHALVEIAVFAAIILGLGEIMLSESFTRAVSLLGGLALIWMAAASLRSLRKGVDFNALQKPYGAVTGGIIFTALNPGFPVWWATAGTRLLVEGFQRMGAAGMLTVFLGHWLADFGWFALVSFAASAGSGTLLSRGWYVKMRLALSLLLVIIGAYFLSTAV
ncbi:MAG: LysE family transporter [Candidatus Altiarchaeota archaeon]|nr:LysE family transporter [Candidatus Altiarchaeota archaeon]